MGNSCWEEWWRPGEHSDCGASAGFGKLPSAFRWRHMITVDDVQSLAPDVIHFLSQAAGAIIHRGQLGAVA
jgi:hypothetical protein